MQPMITPPSTAPREVADAAHDRRGERDQAGLEALEEPDVVS